MGDSDIKSSTEVKDTSHKSQRKQGHRDGENELEGGERFMVITSTEQRQWEAMMKSRRENLVKNSEDYQRWLDSFTRRRLFAYSRIRKLNEARRDRFRFVFKMAEAVKTANVKTATGTMIPETESDELENTADGNNNMEDERNNDLVNNDKELGLIKEQTDESQKQDNSVPRNLNNAE